MNKEFNPKAMAELYKQRQDAGKEALLKAMGDYEQDVQTCIISAVKNGATTIHVEDIIDYIFRKKVQKIHKQLPSKGLGPFVNKLIEDYLKQQGFTIESSIVHLIGY